MTPDFRSNWLAHDLRIADEPLVVSLIKYRMKKDRTKLSAWDIGTHGNLVSSKTYDGKQMPIIDLDFPHHLTPSTTDDHSHLFLDVKMSQLQWIVLMCALRFAGVIETGFFVWSLRRGQNFVRPDGVEKTAEEAVKPTYGWFFKLRSKRD